MTGSGAKVLQPENGILIIDKYLKNVSKVNVPRSGRGFGVLGFWGFGV